MKNLRFLVVGLLLASGFAQAEIVTPPPVQGVPVEGAKAKEKLPNQIRGELAIKRQENVLEIVKFMLEHGYADKAYQAEKQKVTLVALADRIYNNTVKEGDEKRLRDLSSFLSVLRLEEKKKKLDQELKDDKSGKMAVVALKGTKINEALAQFFVIAGKAATGILEKGTAIATSETQKKVEEGDNKTSVKMQSGTGGPDTSLGSGIGRAFDKVDFYGDGAVIGNVVQAGDVGADGKTTHSRTISVKIVTRQSVDNPGTLVDKLGICDVTANSPVYCREVTLSPRGGEHVISLNNNLPEYAVKVIPNKEGNFRIVLGRPKNLPDDVTKKEEPGFLDKLWRKISKSEPEKPKTGGFPGYIDTNLNDLYSLRIKQVKENGQKVSIGDRPYRALAQGGRYGAMLYYAEVDIVDALAKQHVPGLRPRLMPRGMAEVSERKVGQDGESDTPIEGTTENGKPKPDLGKIDDKEYHLELQGPWGHPDSYWKVVPGPGLKPKPKEPPATSAEKDKKSGGSSGSDDKKSGGGKVGGGADFCKNYKESSDHNTYTLGDHTFYLQNSEKNSMLLCVGGKQIISFGGLPVEDPFGKATIAGKDYFTVEMAMLADSVFIDPNSEFMKDGQLKKEHIPGKGKTRVPYRLIHYIPMASMTEDAVIEKNTPSDTGGVFHPTPAKMGAITKRIHTKAKTITGVSVYVGDTAGNAEAAVEAVKVVMNEFGGTTTLNQAQNRSAVLAFVKRKAQEYHGKNLAPDAQFNLTLNLPDEAKTAKTPAMEAVRADYQIDGKTDGEKLWYCVNKDGVVLREKGCDFDPTKIMDMPITPTINTGAIQ